MPVSVLSFDTFPSFIVDKLNANFDFNCIDKNDAAALAALAPKVRALVAKGELSYLSMTPTAGKGEHGLTWVACVCPASKFGHSEGRDPDPVTALIKALDGLPKSFINGKAQPRAPSQPAASEPWDVVS